jgi:hypothetical protein
MKKLLLIIVGGISMLFGILVAFGLIAGWYVNGFPKKFDIPFFMVIAMALYFIHVGVRWIKEAIDSK